MQASTGMDANEQILDIEPDPNRPGVFYAATYLSGVYVTLDGGERWENISGDTFHHSRAQVLALSSDGGVLYAGSTINGVYRLGTPQVSGRQPEPQDGSQENDQAAAVSQPQETAAAETEPGPPAENAISPVLLGGAAAGLLLFGLGTALVLKRRKTADA